MSAADAVPSPEPPREEWEHIVRQQVGRLRFGVVQVFIHEGRVTQVDATERTRLADKIDIAPAPAPAEE